MYKLRRMHLDTVGVPENRFAELTIETVDESGDPTDTLIWMRNGSGKTTIMSLLAAHILPGRRDFLAARKGRRQDKSRTLEDLIQGDDTAHVVAEWEAPDGALLLTGAVWEWTNKRKPTDYNGANSSKLKRLFWALRPELLLDATFETLPLTHRTRGEVDLASFHTWINARAAAGVDAVAETNLDAWHRILADRGFDAELYRYFVTINATEGGIDALFADIRTENDFARYLLGFVADTPRAASVRDLLREVATELALRPAYRTEQEFCLDAVPRLEDLANAHERVRRTGNDRDSTAQAAAAFRRGLLESAALAAGRGRLAADDHAETDEAYRSARQHTDAARRRRDELLRLAAGFWLRDADEALETSEASSGRAQLLMQAWEATEKLLALRRCQADVHAHREAMAVQHDKAEPLLQQADRAAADYVAALDDEVARAEAAMATLDEQTQNEDSSEKSARQRASAADRADAELSTEAEQLGSLIQGLADKRDRAVTGGLLAIDEPADQAAADATRIVEQLTSDLTACDERITVAHGHLDQATAAVVRARTDTEQARVTSARSTATLDELTRRARPLNSSELVATLAQTDELDMLADARRVSGLAAEAVATADAGLLERGVDSSTERLAVRGLEEDRLLPPRPAVRQVLTALREAGGHAVAGWEYVAQHLSPAEAVDVIGTLPEVCDGVVFYGELPVGVLGLAVDDPVVLAPVGIFTDLTATTDSWTVVGPSAARYDREVGSVELSARRDHLAVLDQRTAALRTERDAHAAVAAELRALADTVEEQGGATAVRETAHRDAAVLRDREHAEAAATAVRDAADAALRDTVRRQGALRGDLGRAAGRASQLEELARDLADLDPAIRRLAEIPGLRKLEVDRREVAKQDEEAARRRLDEARRARDRLDTQSRQWARERQAVVVTGSQVGRAPLGGLDVAHQLWTQAKRLASEAFDEPELRRRLDDLVSTQASAGREWGSFPPNVRTEAERLAATPEAQDSLLRVRQREAAAAEVAAAAARVALAQSDRNTAARTVEERRPANRLRHVELAVEPADRAEAEDMARTEDRVAAAHQEQVGQLDARLTQLAGRQAAEDGLARELALRAGRFEEWRDDGTAAAAIPSDRAELDSAADALYRSARDAASALQSAQVKRSQSFDALRTWAADDRFARIADDSRKSQRLRQLFREQPVTVVAERSLSLVVDLTERKARIDEHLAHLDQSQQNVVTRLVDLVESALADLARFSRLSVLPAGIGPWEHREFVQVQPRAARPTDDQMRVRVSDLVDRMVEAGRSLDIEPLDLAWQSTEAAVGSAGFRARILKPDPAQPTQKVDVTDMNKWSGGENLTACLVLFCVMVKLRAENRGRRAGSVVAGGLVPLDNPLGKANYVPFLQLQRTVAAASGVQLLFFTGIGDLPAVRAFDSIVACSKRRARNSGHAYVTVDPDGGSRQAVDRIRLVRRSTEQS